MKTQRIWTDKETNLEPLVAAVESFFKARNFSTRRKQSGKEHVVVITGQHEDGSYVRIDAKIFRKKDEVTVELSAGETTFSKLDTLTGLFFGGYMTLQGLKSEEALSKMEPDFSTYIDQVMLDLRKETDRPAKR